MSVPGKILVIRGGAIGDFILTLPVFAALREQFPQTPIEVLGYSHIASLAKASGYVNEVHSIEARPLASFFAKNGELSKALSDYFAGFAVILSFLYDPDEIFLTNLKRCTRAQIILGTHRPSDRGNLHATQCLLQSLERLAIFDADPVPRLILQDAAPPEVPVIALHPGSGM